MLNPAPRTILIVNIRLIGDVILTTPLIGLLKEAYPDAAIDMLVNRGTGEFLEKDPRVRRVLYSEKGVNGAGRHITKGYLSTIFRKYDIAININASDRGNIAAILAGKKVRFGFHQVDDFFKNIWKKLLLSHTIHNPFPIHVARLCQLVGESIGIEVERLNARVYWDAGDEARVDAVLNGAGTAPYFVIHPFARWRYKYWEGERFAAVSDAIVGKYGLQPIWTSSPDLEEIALLHESAHRCKHQPVLVAGELSLNQMTCLLSRSSLYVGLDTAISHLAATTGVPMVALYGPTISAWWSPWNNAGPVAQQWTLPSGTQRNGTIMVIQKDWECVPCGRAGCDDSGMESRCMAGIEVGEVLDAVGLLLDKTPLLKGGGNAS